MADVIVGLVDVAGPAITLSEISGSANADPFPAALNDMRAFETPVLGGAVVYVDEPTYPDQPAVIAGNFLFDYYYRIWVIPDILNASNPVEGVPIPFLVWNAYPQPLTNTLDSIDTVDATGLSLDLSPGDVFRAVEIKEVNVTIGPTAPLQIAAEFDFNFDLGVGRFYFRATIADFVQMIPDPPVTETWGWLTDVIPSRANVEQRIGLRATPKRSIKYGFLLENEVERRRQYQRWYKSLGKPIILPFYQYQTRITAPSLTGDSKLYFDPALTDLRDGEFLMLMHEATNTGYLIKIDTVDPDGVTTQSPLQVDVPKGWIVAPTFRMRLNDRTGLTMKQVTGHIDVTATGLDYRALFSRPGSAAVISTFDGLQVLDKRPIAVDQSPEAFDANYEVVAGDTGVEGIYVSWPHPVVAMTRQWTIRRRQNPVDMDWWRDFLDGCNGQRVPFLLPTWFEDLVAAEAPTPGTALLRIAGTDYATLYFPHDTFQRLQIETEAGIIWRKVVTADVNPDGSTTLGLDVPFGGTLDDVAISKISFLNRVRLSGDTVTLTHDRLRTQIELATVTVDV